MTSRTGGATAGQLRLLLTAIYYVLGGLALLALVTKAQQSFLPDGIATQIGHNSESVCLALAVGATIQFARPLWLRDGGRRTAWGVVVGVAGFWILLAVGVYYLGLPSSIKTLNEPLAAAGLLALHLGPPRPWRQSWVVPALGVLVVLVGIDVRFVVDQAETVTSVVLVAVSADVVQRSMLRRDVREGTAVWVWWGFLLGWPALMQLLDRQDTFGGYLGDLVDYQARGAEGFWGALLICLYFALRRAVENRAGDAAPAGSTRLPA